MKYKKYKKDDPYSFVFGGFPTIELLNTKKEIVREVLISNKLNDGDEIFDLLNKLGIKYSVGNDITRLQNKGNIYIAGVFEKYRENLEDKNHVVLDNPENMGNLGTIIRSMAAFGLYDLAIIGSIDIFDPRVIRASMGSFFKVRKKLYKNKEEYLSNFGKDRSMYSFILDENSKRLNTIDNKGKFSLIFGNEAHGLDDSYRNISRSVFIPQSKDVDSLNLSSAVTVSLYHFMKDNL